jgi:hypothetical protein
MPENWGDHFWSCTALRYTLPFYDNLDFDTYPATGARTNNLLLDMNNAALEDSTFWQLDIEPVLTQALPISYRWYLDFGHYPINSLTEGTAWAGTTAVTAGQVKKATAAVGGFSVDQTIVSLEARTTGSTFDETEAAFWRAGTLETGGTTTEWTASDDVAVGELRLSPSAVGVFQAGTTMMSLSTRTTGGTWNTSEAANWTYAWRTVFENYQCERMSFVRRNILPDSKISPITPLGFYLSANWMGDTEISQYQQQLCTDQRYAGLFDQCDFVAVPCFLAASATDVAGLISAVVTPRVQAMVNAVPSGCTVFCHLTIRYYSGAGSGTLIPNQDVLDMIWAAMDAGADAVVLNDFWDGGGGAYAWQATQTWDSDDPPTAAVTAYLAGTRTI